MKRIMNSSARGRGRDQVQSSPDLVHLSLRDLRDYRSRLTEEEERVSYWRRLVQARMDIIQTEAAQLDDLSVEDLIKALSETGTGSRRQQLLSVHAHDALPELPELDALWARSVDPHDEEAVRAALESLRAAEQELNSYRNLLHVRLDAATGELIARYAADNDLVFSEFPEPAKGPSGR